MESQKQTQEDKTCKRDDLSKKRQQTYTLLKYLFSGDVNKIIVTHKDRLMRFGFALIEKICQYLNVKIIVMDSNDKEGDFTTQLAQDLIEIITVFSAKLYGRRSSQNRIKQTELVNGSI